MDSIYLIRQAERSKYWILAISLACPVCHNRLWGNGDHAWCRSRDCNFITQWEEVESKAHSYSTKHKYTVMLSGTIHQVGDSNSYIVIGERVYGNKK